MKKGIWGAGLLLMLWTGCAMAPPLENPSERGLAILERVELNGSRQWITIRTRDPENPILLFLAGGPGGSELPSTRLHLGALENRFTVVNWDQPGAGKSAGAVSRRQLTPDRYLRDGIALIDYLTGRFGKEKVYILGESWGTILGIRLCQAVPEKIAAYAGSGQMVNTTENDVRGYRFALELLKNAGRVKDWERLSEQGPPPYLRGNIALKYQRYMGVLNSWMHRQTAGLGEDHDILKDALRAPEYTPADRVRWILALMRTFNRVYPQLEELNFLTQAPSLDVPCYFILGRYDANAYTDYVEEYARILEAPRREIIWFENSGHPPLYSEPEKLVKTMERILREQEPGV